MSQNLKEKMQPFIFHYQSVVTHQDLTSCAITLQVGKNRKLSLVIESNEAKRCIDDREI